MKKVLGDLLFNIRILRQAGHWQDEDPRSDGPKGDTPEYVNKMQQEVFEVLAGARSLENLKRIEPKAREVYRRYLDELGDADVKDLAIHRRVSRLNYSRRCAEASAVQARMKQGLPWLRGWK
jgi:DNA polymerase elongation subunit (family B)